jgi:hypothetical protein
MAADGFAFSYQILELNVYHPLVMQFGADGRLYVGQENGTIMAFRFDRYTNGLIYLEEFEEISAILAIPNHNDEGIPSPNIKNRLITGLASAGTVENPILYVSSSDPRTSRAENQSGIDSNSGMITRLRWTGGDWDKVDIVRGLPRSFENHANNGLAYDSTTNILYLAQGGNTNMGLPSSAFGNLPEYPYSAAILQIDLTMLEAMPVQMDANGQAYLYDLPTLDDSSRENDEEGHDINDPFGGNLGANAAILSSESPVQIFATGFRNPYEILLSSSGYLYTVDSAARIEEGGYPEDCENLPISSYPFHLHRLSEAFYGGHPNPSRSECHLLAPPQDGAWLSLPEPSYGFAEYQSSHFAGVLNGALLLSGFGGHVYYTFPQAEEMSLDELAAGLGNGIIDIAVSPESSPLEGTIWLINLQQNQLITLSPIENYHCEPETGDSDKDAVDAQAEIAAGTDPCSASSKP